MKKFQFLCKYDIDNASLVKIQGASYAPWMHDSIKEGVTFVFPSGLPNRGEAVLVHFTRDKRQFYSALRPEGTTGTEYIRATNPAIRVRNVAPYGDREVVRVYRLFTPPPEPEKLWRLVLAEHPIRQTSRGGSTAGYLAGDGIKFVVSGGGESATGHHGSCHYVAVVDGEAYLKTTYISNTGKVSQSVENV